MPTLHDKLEAKLHELLDGDGVDIDAFNALESLGSVYKDHARRMWNIAMSKAQSEMPVIQRDATNNHTGQKYTSLQALYEACMPVWTKNGFSNNMRQEKSESGDVFVLTVSHSGGHEERFTWFPSLDRSGIKGEVNKTDIQALGSTTSYAQRYLLRMAYNIVTGEENDNDGNAPSAKPNKRRLTKPKPSKEAGTDMVSEDMLAVIDVFIDKTNTSPDKILTSIGLDGGKTLGDMSATQAKEVLHVLKTKLKRLNKSNGNK